MSSPGWRLRTVAVFLVAGAAACEDDPAVPEEPERTTFEVTVANVATGYPLLDAGTFDTPVGADAAGPLMPGDSFVVEFVAGRGDRVYLASMFVQSNDLFVGTDEDGIDLFEDGGEQVEGPVTDQIGIWNAGTEVDQELGAGADQPLIGGPETGDPDPDEAVRAATRDDFDNLPAVEDIVDVRLESAGTGTFRLTIENVSADDALVSSAGESPVFLSGGVYAVAPDDGVLFLEGEVEPGEGLETLAEDGDPSALGAVLAPRAGLTHLLSPGVAVAHETPGVLFEAGAEASPDLETLAEDGDAVPLQLGIGSVPGVTANVIFAEPDGGDPGPAPPGTAYTFRIEVTPESALSLATMLVQSNDLFLAPAAAGISLFDGSGTPISGDVTDQVMLWDAGTEVNQPIGIGPDQAPRQDGADTGEEEDGVVLEATEVEDAPAVADVIRVTVTPVSGG